MQLMQFVCSEHMAYLEKAKRSNNKPIVGFGQFWIDNQARLERKYVGIVKEIISTDVFYNNRQDVESFKIYAEGLRFDSFMTEFLTDAGEIKPEKLKTMPSKFMGYGLKYSEDLISKTVAGCSLEKYLALHPPKVWTIDKFT